MVTVEAEASVISADAVSESNCVRQQFSCSDGGLVTDKPDSPHLLIPKIKAEVLCCVADNDDKRDPAAKDKVKEAFAVAHLKATVEVFNGCNHGWTVRGSQVYDNSECNRVGNSDCP